MVRDFRRQLNENRPSASQELEAHLSHGRIPEAIKAARRAGVELSEITRPLESAARKWVLGHRQNELLSVYHKFGIRLQYPVVELLRGMYENRDYHSFLKGCDRFAASDAFSEEIRHAIDARRAEGLHLEADAWEKKLCR